MRRSNGILCCVGILSFSVIYLIAYVFIIPFKFLELLNMGKKYLKKGRRYVLHVTDISYPNKFYLFNPEESLLPVDDSGDNFLIIFHFEVL